MKTIAIIGSKGMLGSDITRLGRERGYEVIEFDQTMIDITQVSDVEKLKQFPIEVLINCAAFTDVNGAEDSSDTAFKVNAFGPEYLAQVSRDMNIPIVQVSTDYVFNGTQSEGYDEDSQQFGPLNVYGQSKLEGENRVIAHNPKHYIVRTSWLFGEHGKNFVSTMIKLGTERDALTVVNDQFGNPTFTEDLASSILDLLADEAPYGTYHLTNSTPDDAGVTWFDLASYAISAKGLKTHVSPVSSDAFPQKATRPQYSTLLNTKRPKLRDYREAVLEYIQKFSV